MWTVGEVLDMNAGVAALDGGLHDLSSTGIIVVVVALLPGCVGIEMCCGM